MQNNVMRMHGRMVVGQHIHEQSMRNPNVLRQQNCKMYVAVFYFLGKKPIDDCVVTARPCKGKKTKRYPRKIGKLVHSKDKMN